MKLKQVLLAAVAAGALMFNQAEAANVPILTPSPNISEASQIVPTINTLIQSLNTNLGGEFGSSPVQATTTQTTIQTLGTITLNGGTLANAGQAVRITCFGTGTATGTNTLTIQFGTATAFAVAGSATTAGVFQASVLVMKTGASTQQILSQGSFNATLTTATEQSATQTDTSPINVTCSGTSTTSGNFTLNGMIGETIK
jgi:hypothetical protein